MKRSLRILLPFLAVLSACGARPSEETDTGSTEQELTPPEAQMYGGEENWSPSFSGTNGTFFADVTGDGWADAVAVNANGILVRSSRGTGFNDSQPWLSNSSVGGSVRFLADVTGPDPDGKVRADAIAFTSSAIAVWRSTGTAPFLSGINWSTSGFPATKGNFVADVTGDGRADVIAVNSGAITVRRSSGANFGNDETWLSTNLNGVTVFFADVTGDEKADEIEVDGGGVYVRPSDGLSSFSSTRTNWTTDTRSAQKRFYFADATGDHIADLLMVGSSGIQMRKSNRFGFGGVENMADPGPVEIAVADLTGDSRADVIVRRSNNGLGAHIRRNRSIPIRFVVFPNPASPVTDPQINASVANLNVVYKRDFGLQFSVVAIHRPVAPGFADGLDNSVESNTLTVGPGGDLAAAHSFNSSCQRGTDQELHGVSEYKALFRIAARCAKRDEVLVYVATTPTGNSQGFYPWEGNFIRLEPGAFQDPGNGAVPHEVGHYLGLPHVFGYQQGQGGFQKGYNFARHPNIRNPKTGQETGMSVFWDLVHAPLASELLTFDSPEGAASYESLLRPIQATTLGLNIPVQFTDGWFCPGTRTNECPPGPDAPNGTIGLGVGSGALSQIWYSGSKTTSYFGSRQLKGLGLQLPDGGPGINSMSYSYVPNTGPEAYRYGFCGSQIEQVQRGLAYDVPLPTLDAGGHVLMSGRPALGISNSTRSLTYEQVGGVAKTTPGSIASNGFDTWVIGGGDAAYHWNPVSRIFEGPYGSQLIQLSLESDGTRTGPLAIIGSGDHGTVKRWDGTSFVPLINGGNNCAYSLAAGGTYTWVIGCDPPNGLGERTIHRYSPMTGWMADTGNGWAVEIAVDASGTPWVRNASNRIFKGVLDPVTKISVGWTWTPGIAAHLGSGAVYGGFLYATGNGTYADGVAKDLPISVLGLENPAHIYAQRNDPGLNFADNGAPQVNFVQVAGSLPYIWGVDANGGIWYSH